MDYEATVRKALARVAPDANVETLDPDAELQEELGLDSMDFITFLGELFRLSGISVTEADYPQVRTMSKCVAYLRAHA